MKLNMIGYIIEMIISLEDCADLNLNLIRNIAERVVSLERGAEIKSQAHIDNDYGELRCHPRAASAFQPCSRLFFHVILEPQAHFHHVRGHFRRHPRAASSFPPCSRSLSTSSSSRRLILAMFMVTFDVILEPQAHFCHVYGYF